MTVPTPKKNGRHSLKPTRRNTALARAKRIYLDYLQDIVDHAEKAMRVVQGISFDDFGDNEEKVFAVVKMLEIIGEAARHLPKSVRDKYTSCVGCLPSVFIIPLKCYQRANCIPRMR